MPKVVFEGVTYDSQLEIDYANYLKEKGYKYIYHPKPIQLTPNISYTPDFIVIYPSGRVDIIETKGYNQYSYQRDNLIHSLMLQKTEQELKDYLEYNNVKADRAVYKKIKFIKSFGFVDWEFKNPNTLLNKRKAKIDELKQEIKELKQFKKDVLRYLGYKFKLENNEKLTKTQWEWMIDYEDFYKQLINTN